MKSKQERKTRSQNGARAKDAIALLEADHDDARAILAMLAESSEEAVEKRLTLLGEVSAALWVHMQIEEELFYPAFEAAEESADDEVKAIEARAEHDASKAALARLERCDPASTEFRAIAKVVHDFIALHATEEESSMFPRARKLLGRDRLVTLGEEMALRKDELLATGGYDKAERRASKTRASTPPESEART